MFGKQRPTNYQIKIEGHLSAIWVEEFDQLEVVLTEDGETHLTGPLADQAALHGLLTRIRDLGITLIAIQRLPSRDDSDRGTAKRKKSNQTTGEQS